MSSRVRARTGTNKLASVSTRSYKLPHKPNFRQLCTGTNLYATYIEALRVVVSTPNILHHDLTLAGPCGWLTPYKLTEVKSPEIATHAECYFS